MKVLEFLILRELQGEMNLEIEGLDSLQDIWFLVKDRGANWCSFRSKPRRLILGDVINSTDLSLEQRGNWYAPVEKDVQFLQGRSIDRDDPAGGGTAPGSVSERGLTFQQIDSDDVEHEELDVGHEEPGGAGPAGGAGGGGGEPPVNPGTVFGASEDGACEVEGGVICGGRIAATRWRTA